MIHWTIYKITSPTGRIYIGMTSNFKTIMSMYKSSSAKDQRILLASIKKYGFESHVVEKAEEFYSDRNFAINREVFNIDFHKSNYSKYPENRGMNLTDGGEGAKGLRHTKEANARKSAAMIKKMSNPEVRAKMSEKWADPQKRKEMSDLIIARYKNPSERTKTSFLVSAAKSLPHRKEKYAITTSKRWENGKMSRNLEALLECNLRKRKAVEQYDMNGNFIKEHASLTDAASAVNSYASLVRHVLSGKRKTTGGFFFKYKTESDITINQQTQP